MVRRNLPRVNGRHRRRAGADTARPVRRSLTYSKSTSCPMTTLWKCRTQIELLRPMKPKRATIECCNILLATLRGEEALSRSQVVAMNALTGDEFTRAKNHLLKEGLICRSSTMKIVRRNHTRYKLTEKALELSVKLPLPLHQARAQINFENLLRAWKISLPSGPVALPSVKRFRFTNDELDQKPRSP